MSVVGLGGHRGKGGTRPVSSRNRGLKTSLDEVREWTANGTTWTGPLTTEEESVPDDDNDMVKSLSTRATRHFLPLNNPSFHHARSHAV